jgi:hypothetical protein
MEKVQMFWDPVGLDQDSFGASKIRGAPTAGDTSYVRPSIRMSSIDTPAKHPLVKSNAPDHDRSTRVLADWLDQGMSSNMRKLCGLSLSIIFILPVL